MRQKNGKGMKKKVRLSLINFHMYKTEYRDSFRYLLLLFTTFTTNLAAFSLELIKNFVIHITCHMEASEPK